MSASDAFWAHAAGATTPRDPSLDARLDAAATTAAAAYPDVALPAADLLAYLGRRFPGGDVADFLDAIDPAELHLVAACARNDAAALRRFDAGYLAEVATGVRRLACAPDELDEIRQRVRVHLHGLGPDGAPRLLGLTARGDLRALVRLIALRTGLSLRRATPRAALTDDAELLDAATDDATPSLALLRAEHRALFRTALAGAVAELDPRHRTAMRLHALDRVPLARVATIFQVDRATISRWLVTARADLLAGTRRRLAAAGIAPDHLDSFLDVLRSRFDVSLQALL